MKKVVLLISTLLFVFGCTMDEKLGGPADLQYIVLSKTNTPSDGTQQIDLVKNTGYVTLIPDDELDDPNAKKYAYTYSGIKRKLVVRNSTATTQNYTFNLKFNDHQVFFISPARDRKTGKILKDESCFLEDVQALTTIPEIKLASQKNCTFDVFAKPNQSSQLRRINLNDAYDFVEDAKFKGNGKYEARLSIESENSLNEYNLSVTMIESVPIVMDEIVDPAELSGTVDFGYASVNTVRLKDVVTCPENENQLCLPFVVVINDDAADNLTLDYQAQFGTGFSLHTRSTCRQVEHEKNGEFVKSLDKAYLPCMIMFQFWPRHPQNHHKYFQFKTPEKSFYIKMNGNTDNETQLAPSIRPSSDQSPSKVIKFNDINLVSVLDPNKNLLQEIATKLMNFDKKYIFFEPKVWKESDGRTLVVPYEVKFLNIADTASLVDKGFVLLLPTIMEYVNNKMGFQFLVDNTTENEAETASVLEERGIKVSVREKTEIAYPCVPFETSVVVNRICYVQVVFLPNVFNNIRELNDNFTRTKRYEYLLETNVGNIPLFGTYISPCDWSGLSIGVCKASDDFPPRDRDIDIKEFLLQKPSYEGSIFIGSVTDRQIDNVTTYRQTFVSSSAKSQQFNMRLTNTVSNFYFEKDIESQTACNLVNSDERNISFSLEGVNNSCTYLINFKYPEFNELAQQYGGYFDMIETTTTDTTLDSSVKQLIPVYASVLNSLQTPEPRVEKVGDNTTSFFTIAFEKTFKNTYSKSIMAIKVHKPDDDTKLNIKVDSNFSDAFKIMAQTTCDVNYSRSKLAIKNFPDPYETGKDYCLIVISAMPPNVDITNKTSLTLVKEYTDPLTDRVSVNSDVYKFAVVGQVQDFNDQQIFPTVLTIER